MNHANHGAMVPRDHDVLFGRGGAIASHPGNLRLRALVRRHKPRFDQSKNMRKRTVAMAIVDQIERGGGRFLAEDPHAVAAKAASIGERRWVEVDREKSEEKVMHRLREKDKGVPMDMMADGDSGMGMEAGNNPFQGGPPSGIDAAAGGLAPSQQMMQHSLWGNNNAQQQSMGNQQCINSQPSLDANELQQLQTEWQSGTLTGDNTVMNGLGGMGAQEQSQRDMLAGMNSLLHQFGDANLSGSAGGMGMQMQQSMGIALPSSNGPSPDLGGQLQQPVPQQPAQQQAMASPQMNGLVNGSNQQALDVNQLQQSMENHSLCDGLARQLPLDAKLQHLGAQTSWSGDTSNPGGFGSQSNTAGHTMNGSTGMQQHEQTMGSVAQSSHTMNNNLAGIGMLQQGNIFSNGFDAAPIGISEWMQTAGEVSSKNAYIVGAVELGWTIAKNLNDLIESGMTVPPGEIVSKNVLIFMESSDPASFAVRPAIREVQIQAMGPDGGAHQTRAGSSREVCASLGQILLELFSMNQSSSMDFSSQRTQENTGTQPVQKRQATTAPTRGSISSDANNLLVGLVMPASITRLVCDLLDAADEACPSTALTTLEEALEDLSQMRSDPDLLLFDRTNPEEALDHFYSLDEHLFGRKEELAALMKAKDNVSTSVLGDGRTLVGQGSDFVCEAAFVGGYAGSGKSSLLLPLVSACNKEQWFVLGCKFDKQTAPVKVLYSALDDFFGKWGDGSDSDFNPALMGSFREVCECICSTIDDDGFHQLSELVPNFTKMYPHLVKRTGTSDQVVVSSMDKVGSAKRRLQNLIHILFKSLCSAGRPVLLVLDDLQWCDSFVLEGLTEFIVSYMHSEGGISNNRRRRGLLLAGAYRSKEVTDSHPFIESINCLKNSQKANITMLTAGELSKADVARLISSKLCLPRRYTRELANIVHSKTRGNPFFVIQFLRSIVSNKMLEFSVRSRRWIWDCDVVEMQMISDGVAGLLATSFNQLPSQLTKTMKIVSCLGSQVEVLTVQALDATKEVLPFTMLDEMELAVKEGILERAGPVYQFTHDIVQQSIYELIPPRCRAPLHKTIGQNLLKSAADNPTIHLLAADQINMFCKDATPSSPEERSQFASSNARAAKFAIAGYSFERARSYIDVGMRLLEPNHWETQYALSLNLYEMSASVSCINGDVSNLSTCLGAVLSHSKSFEDSLKASSLLVKLLASNSQFEDARSNCFMILSKLGEEISPEVSPSAVSNELSEMQTLFKSVTYNQIKQLPPMTAWKKINAMKFLNMLCLYCVASKPLLLPRLSCRMLKLTLECGSCEDTIVGIATAGYSISLFADDIELAADLCRVTESLIQNSPKKHLLRARLCNELYAALKLSREPCPSVMALLPELVNSAMLVGDIEIALICRWNHSSMGYWVGAMSLPTISEQSLLLMKEAAKYQQNTVLYNTMAILQSCMHLSGGSSNEVEIKSLDELTAIGEETSSPFVVWQIFMHKMSNQFWSRDFMAVAKLSEEYSAKHGSASQQKRSLHPMRIFYEGIVYLKLARCPGDTKKRREMGEKALETIAGYATSLSKWNFENKALLLQAELHCLNGDLQSTEAAYEASINSAREHKFIHEEALAYELHGRFCIENYRAEKGSNQLRVAVSKYNEWGATKKANNVQHYLDSVSSLPTGKNITVESCEVYFLYCLKLMKI